MSRHRLGQPLSQRQREVLQLVASGLPTKTVGYELGLSITSVKTHLKAASKRLGAKNRVHLAVLFSQL